MSQDKRDRFLGQVITELGISVSAVLIHLGDRLGLYRCMADGVPLTSAALAERAGLAERYVREWLHNQAAAGWLDYHPADETFVLPVEHAQVVADSESPTFLLGGFDGVAAAWADLELLASAFRTGEGIPWHLHDRRHLSGLERSFRPLYRELLVSSWLPSLDDVVAKLERGARIADVGCGAGAASIILAKAFPASTVTGFDFEEDSVVTARARAEEAEAGPNIAFEVAVGDAFPGTYDLVCVFNALHDMGDPIGAASHIRNSLAPDGTLLLVEPAAADLPEHNHHPVSRFFYAASAVVCVPGALAQGSTLGLGNQVGPSQWHDLLTKAGFASVRLVSATPVVSVIEARP